MTAPAAAADPCPRCGARAGMVWVHGHGQCAACGSNVFDCCQGADCDLAPDAGGPNEKG